MKNVENNYVKAGDDKNTYIQKKKDDKRTEKILSVIGEDNNKIFSWSFLSLWVVYF